VAARSVGLVVVCIILLAGFAGCAGPSKASTQEIAKRGATKKAVVNMTVLEARLGDRLVPPNDATVADWFVLPGTTGPEGNLTAFRWTIPAGSVIGLRTPSQTGLVLEVVPIIPGSGNVTQWCLLAFRQKEGKAFVAGDPETPPSLVAGAGISGGAVPELGGIKCSFEQDRTTRDPLVPTPNNTKVPASDVPSFVIYQDRLIQDLDNLFFVVAAKGPVAGDFGIAFHLLQQFPTFEEKPSASLDQFVMDRGANRPRGLNPISHGQGLQVNHWLAEYGIGAGNALIATYEERAGDLAFSTPMVDGRPATALWNFNVSSTYENAGGWSTASGRYTGICATGRWAAWANLNGPHAAGRNLIMQHAICTYIYPYIAELLVFGSPAFRFYGGGADKASATMEIVVHNGAAESLFFDHVAIGTTLDELLGIPSNSSRFIATGASGNVPP
jgi:hypothetical protein